MKLPLLSGREVYAALERLGFLEIHRKGATARWSMRMADGSCFQTNHQEIDRYTLRGSLRDAYIDEDSFLEQIR